MLTIFSTPKPFKGHINTIQRNAIKSWTLLHPDVEIILFGDEEGTGQICREYGIRNESDVRRSSSGAKYLDQMFAHAQRTARHAVICYINCDILLMSDFVAAVSVINAKFSRFLMIGQRWDTPITDACKFSEVDWQEGLHEYAKERGQLVGPKSIDYFVFSRGLYDMLPPLVIGRCWWDHWLVWKAKEAGAAVVDATPTVMAIHQNHDYSYHPDGFLGTLYGEEALENIRLAGGKRHLRIIEDAKYRLTERGIKFRLGHSVTFFLRLIRERMVREYYSLWFSLLGLSRPLRHRLGLRQGFLARNLGKAGSGRG